MSELLEKKKSSAHIPQLSSGKSKSSKFQDIIKGLFFDAVILFANSPSIVVVAPHANQFVDGAIILSRIRAVANRNSSSVIAEASYKRRFIGFLAKLANSIPVPRAQDNLKFVEGEIYAKDGDLKTIHGKGTRFTKFTAKGLLGLPQSAGNSVIEEIKNDEELILRKPFKGEKAENLLSKGTKFKYADKVENDVTFQNVFEHLHKGGNINIFPEGGSHDRPDLLPIKAGVSIMALGAAAADPTCKIKIVPTGLNYFHRNEFRSRSVVEFGAPIVIGKEQGEAYEKNPREAVGKLLDEITTALRSVTLTAPDYDTLMVIQAVRRLYVKKAPLSLVVEMNRKFLKGYLTYKDDPRVSHLKDSVLEYNKKLEVLGLKDHQVELAVKHPLESLVILIVRLFKLAFFGALSLPGTILFSPIFFTTDHISRKKQKEALAGSVVKIKAVDVIATWKIIIATIAAPALYITYSIIGTWLSLSYNIFGAKSYPNLLVFIGIYALLISTTYAAFRIGEIGMDIFKSLPPLISSVFGSEKELLALKETRERLSLEITEVVNELGPSVFPDFEDFHRRHLDQLSEEIRKEEEARYAKIKARRASRKERTESGEKENRSRSASASSTGSSVSNALSRVGSEDNFFSDIPILGDGGYGGSSTPSEHESDSNQYSNIKEITGSSATSEEASAKLRRAMREKQGGFQ
ncbi:Glycerol-3-phosphate O-acyltransferase 1 [Wickerhamomyces ciferrii]|uniref:Glycerol-3-phosphate O-acyltransferase 1 n=1 Tax=Wickerhamomyces ciferrii (strain ATCC 14091 / BCRC 22168 / CBS 111 / JCM 3599 / NBRC 0793 / NRRL Y-1031 F-60-10) TaxID=1206466 RepID=K0KHV3_WICCF|nr:Glycerol-3-phosphate O-acyltransferase 1 [Wickerhamomyces ciferrii]CCH40979.1 Glycerol-3-phosphate O-acyltransferase 1 [Wickerhamomyces ciferrii]